MGTEHWIAIAVALIGIAGPLLLYILQSFGSSKQIKTIATTTSEIKPKIDNIDHRTEKQSEKIDILVADVEYRKRLESSFPKGVSGKDMIHAGTTAMLEENENLLRQYRELSLEYNKAQNQISELSTQNTRLRNKIQELEVKLQRERSKNQPPKPRSRDWDYER